MKCFELAKNKKDSSLKDCVGVFFSVPDTKENADEITDKNRLQYINNTKNEALKNQRICVWRLLQRAIESHLGIAAVDCAFEKEQSGAWRCDGFFFSVSHTNGLVAVALSHEPCGIDVEKVIKGRMTDRHAKKILTPFEREEYSKLDKNEKESYLYEKWTTKESLFKLSGEESVASKIYDDKGVVRCARLKVNDELFSFSLASRLEKAIIYAENLEIEL